MPDDLAKIRQLDHLLADRTDIAVAALTKRRRVTVGRDGGRVRIRWQGLIQHRLPPWFFWFFEHYSSPRLLLAHGGFNRRDQRAPASGIGDGLLWMGLGFAVTLSAKFTYQGFIEFSLWE
ncbi:hypothetical protein RFN28_32925 [Mesorhizobium sp. VK24D]|uniref:Uncharacterized protein n=1 Tax=Mesorhizobium album TaxID=3072314 RepID=A0ABU4YBA1_9HYPH|nr:hypothetical protein [Mesorhizobium sp. VK24D]MDX8483219.1 hypothetical protein [Mesorhizobium sp. VK24D]